MFVFDWRLLTMVDAEQLTLGTIDFWCERIRLRNAAPPKIKVKLGQR